MNGIILRTIFYKDSSKLIYVYTNQGIKSFIARNVLSMKSPLRVLSDPFKKVDLTVKDKPLASVEDVKVITHYPKTKTSYEKTLLTHLISEIILKNFTDEDDHEKGYSLLSKVFDQIENKDDPFIYYLMFSLKSLYLLGFGLRLKTCMTCGLKATAINPFSLEVSCETHGSNALNIEVYELVTDLLISDASTYQANPISTSLKTTLLIMSLRLFETHLDFKPKSKDAYMSFLKEQS